MKAGYDLHHNDNISYEYPGNYISTTYLLYPLIWCKNTERNISKVFSLIPLVIVPAMPGVFSTEMYADQADQIISSHNSSTPLFLMVAFQVSKISEPG